MSPNDFTNHTKRKTRDPSVALALSINRRDATRMQGSSSLSRVFLSTTPSALDRIDEWESNSNPNTFLFNSGVLLKRNDSNPGLPVTDIRDDHKASLWILDENKR